MFNCNLCINYDICPEPCEEMERSFKWMGVYSKDYIRKRQDRTYSPEDIDKLTIKMAFKLKYGKSLHNI